MSPHLAALSHEEPPRLLSNVLLKPHSSCGPSNPSALCSPELVDSLLTLVLGYCYPLLIHLQFT